MSPTSISRHHPTKKTEATWVLTPTGQNETSEPTDYTKGKKIMAWVNLGAVLDKVKNDEGKKGISMRKFAEKIGVQPTDVTKLFKEGKDIKVSTLLYWSEILEVPVRDFFDDNLSREEMTMPRPLQAGAIYKAMENDGTIKKLKDMNKKKQKGRK